MYVAYVAFKIASQSAFRRLADIALALRLTKEGDPIPNEKHWKSYFLPTELETFWSEDGQDWENWFGDALPNPSIRNRSKPSLPAPWTVDSMIDAILEGDYTVVGIRKEGDSIGVLDFEPHGFPFGGTTPLEALVAAFGHTVLGSDDGTGYTIGENA